MAELDLYDRFRTRAVRLGLPRDEVTGALVEPICLTTTFEQRLPGKPQSQYVYSRPGNPSRVSLERCIADLESASHGLVFSSGLAATAMLMIAYASNSHVACMANLYSGKRRYLTLVGPKHGVAVSFADNMEEELEGVLRDDAKLVWIETPRNPTLSLVDIAAVSTVARRQGALTVVDNTFLSLYIQNPLKFGADLVLYLVTKFINGHSDVLMGAIAFKSPKLKSELSLLQNAMGSVPSPSDCWLAHRGNKTLYVRARTASETAKKLAVALEECPHVVTVIYPGLISHPQHPVAAKQHRESLGGGMIAFRIKGCGEAAEKFCESSRYFTLAESLSGVKSLCEIPACMTHTAIAEEERQRMGIYQDLIRLSVGLEDAEDLLEDVASTLAKVAEFIASQDNGN